MRPVSDWIAAHWAAPRQIIAGTTLKSADVNDFPLPGKPCWLKQVHGTKVVTAGHFEQPPEADAAVKAAQGSDPFVCVVRTADCLPLLMCSKDGGVFAAAHAGWRGLAAGVIENTISKLNVDAVDLLVWLGPAISQVAFEVGDEVRDAFLAHDPKASACFEANARGRWQADLYELARQRLNAAGVLAVSGGEFCTYSDEERFYSYRRNPDCGRLVSFIGLLTP
jgi:YfiH family protein